MVFTDDWRRKASCGNPVCTRAINIKSAGERSRLYKARNLAAVHQWQAANPHKVKASGAKTKWRKRLRKLMHLALEARWREIEHEKEKRGHDVQASFYLSPTSQADQGQGTVAANRAEPQPRTL